MIPSTATVKGDVWNATIKASNGTIIGRIYSTPSVTIENSIPILTNVSISLAYPKLNEALTLYFAYSDPDSDPQAAVQIEWYKNSILQPAYANLTTIPGSAINGSGDLWKAKVRASDGDAFGAWVDSNTVEIGATPPPANDTNPPPSNGPTPPPADGSNDDELPAPPGTIDFGTSTMILMISGFSVIGVLLKLRRNKYQR